MKTLSTTLLILVIASVCSYSRAADAPSPTPTTTSTPSSSAPSLGRMRELETRMNNIFGDAFRNAGDWFNRSNMASSVDVREQNDKYVARVYLPHFDTSNAEVNLENGVLHIVANGKSSANGKTEAEHYEQSISLPKPVQSDKMQVQRKPDFLVITVPERTAGSAAVASSTTRPFPETSPAADEWESSISNAFAQLNTEMNRAFNETFPDNFNIGPHASQLESAVKMDDQKNKYVVHFYLPEQNISNARVKFDNGQLHVTAKEESNTTSQSGGGSAKVTGEYSATISVPGPVNEDEMKVDRQANAVVVTLPKA